MPDRISVNGTELEYQLRGTGTGEPVVLIHWGVAATWAEPLLDQPALASRYQLLSYHRAGFARSGRLQGPPAMAAHAAHCHQLLRELGITRAHIVGHSSSVPVALQLALDAPEAVQPVADLGHHALARLSIDVPEGEACLSRNLGPGHVGELAERLDVVAESAAGEPHDANRDLLRGRDAPIGWRCLSLLRGG